MYSTYQQAKLNYDHDKVFPASRGSFPGVRYGRKETSAMGRKWLY